MRSLPALEKLLRFLLGKDSTIRRQFGSTWLGRLLRLQLNYWWVLRPKLTRQLKQMRSRDVPSVAAGPHVRILVTLIETSHYQYYQILALVKALQMRGAEIKVLLCDSRLNGCEIKSIKAQTTDPCLQCRFNHKHLIPLFEINTLTLSDFVCVDDVLAMQKIAKALARNYPSSYFYEGINIIPMTTDSVTRYFYGAVPEHMSPDLERIRSHHLESSMIGIKVAQSIFSQWKPDSLLGNMTVYSAWSPYVKVAEQQGTPFHTISMSQFNYKTVQYNWPDLYINSNRYMKWLSTRQSRTLISSERECLATFISERSNGTAQIFSDYKYFDSGSISLDQLRIDPDKRNIFLFSNVYWDVGMSETGALYHDVISWVLDSIDLVRDRTDVHLYVKPHPAELFDSARSLKSVSHYIQESFPVLPSNVTIISPNLRINTYDLFKYINLGVVYNGTLGLEMLLAGIPVVCTALAPYGYLNSVNVPKTREDYRIMLSSQTSVMQPKRSEVELFAYFYFIKSCIPWTLTKRAYGDNFNGFSFETLDDLAPGKDPYLDHICNCILNTENTVIEAWETTDVSPISRDNSCG